MHFYIFSHVCTYFMNTLSVSVSPHFNAHNFNTDIMTVPKNQHLQYLGDGAQSGKVPFRFCYSDIGFPLKRVLFSIS